MSADQESRPDYAVRSDESGKSLAPKYQAFTFDNFVMTIL